MITNSQIPQQLGQYLYQQINDDWSKAMLILDCQHDEVITCQAFYENEAMKLSTLLLFLSILLIYLKHCLNLQYKINQKIGNVRFLISADGESLISPLSKKIVLKKVRPLNFN
ncbi:hypothetical protein [Pseudoalteromonas shioyasakiensis]|uniref:hypothetical protein n=1 Tax=Pseudoalteromonas shioyasakiensis TaxID=1190813 RepID=UPI003F9F1F9C